jgi:hypothetical protein
VQVEPLLFGVEIFGGLADYRQAPRNMASTVLQSQSPGNAGP